MASELSKLIEDQLQKVDEETALTPTEKQRLLSSSLRIKTSPGKKSKERTPIVKLSKEQPSPPSISGSSVPVPSGQSWVVGRDQRFQWTKWRIGVAVGIVAVLVIALYIAFSHPSSKIHHTDVTGFTEGEEGVIKPQQDLGGQEWEPPSQHPPAAVHAQTAAEYPQSEPTQLNKEAVETAWSSSSTEPSTHKKDHAHKEHPHKSYSHGHPGQHPAGASAAAASAHVAAGHLLAPAAPPALAPAPALSALPPQSVLALAPSLLAPWLGPGFTEEEAEAEAEAAGGEPTAGDGWYGLTAGIHQTVPGVGVNLTEVHKPHTVDDTTMVAAANDAWDKIHSGEPDSIELQQEYGVPGVATMAAPSEYLAKEEEGDEEWVGEDSTEPDLSGGYAEDEDLTG